MNNDDDERNVVENTYRGKERLYIAQCFSASLKPKVIGIMTGYSESIDEFLTQIKLDHMMRASESILSYRSQRFIVTTAVDST
ncbi:hypothetical protein EVAR_26733_1 [Eumeta japonica]|uniref:Uncharacterized protein n=1 Tax=Eumeta variegata TaxID=151549 RepID=A0A4C1X937_EUMVA|nr:hypothetical protein EVAR_26733_1 [Eumeta japonica]